MICHYVYRNDFMYFEAGFKRPLITLVFIPMFVMDMVNKEFLIAKSTYDMLDCTIITSIKPLLL